MLTVSALDMVRGNGTLLALLPENTLPQSHHKKNISKIPNEGKPTKYLTSVPQSCQGIQKQAVWETVTACGTFSRHNN